MITESEIYQGNAFFLLTNVRVGKDTQPAILTNSFGRESFLKGKSDKNETD
jgi:hypothetical protein